MLYTPLKCFKIDRKVAKINFCHNCSFPMHPNADMFYENLKAYTFMQNKKKSNIKPLIV